MERAARGRVKSSATASATSECAMWSVKYKKRKKCLVVGALG